MSSHRRMLELLERLTVVLERQEMEMAQYKLAQELLKGRRELEPVLAPLVRAQHMELSLGMRVEKRLAPRPVVLELGLQT